MRNNALAFFLFIAFGLFGGYIIAWPIVYTMSYIESVTQQDRIPAWVK